MEAFFALAIANLAFVEAIEICIADFYEGKIDVPFLTHSKLRNKRDLSLLLSSSL